MKVTCEHVGLGFDRCHQEATTLGRIMRDFNGYVFERTAPMAVCDEHAKHEDFYTVDELELMESEEFQRMVAVVQKFQSNR